MLSSVACPALQYFSTLYERHDIREKVTEHKLCVLIFCKPFPETVLILRRTGRDGLIMYISLHVKYPPFLMQLEFSQHIFEKYSNTKFNENPMRELFHADRHPTRTPPAYEDSP